MTDNDKGMAKLRAHFPEPWNVNVGRHYETDQHFAVARFDATDAGDYNSVALRKYGYPSAAEAADALIAMWHAATKIPGSPNEFDASVSPGVTGYDVVPPYTPEANADQALVVGELQRQITRLRMALWLMCTTYNDKIKGELTAVDADRLAAHIEAQAALQECGQAPLDEIATLKRRLVEIGADHHGGKVKMDECMKGDCLICGALECPMGEPLHYHGDGCPECDTQDDAE